MRPIYSSFFFFKVLRAIATPLFLIFAFEISGSPIQVGIVAWSLTLGEVLGSSVWGRISARLKSKKWLFIGGVSSYLLLSFLYISKNLLMLNLIAFIFSFINVSTYVCLIFFGFSKNLKKKLARIEEIGGVGYLLGLLIGLSSKFISPQLIFLVISVSSTPLFFLTFKTVRDEIFKEFRKGIFILEDLLNLLARIEREFVKELGKFFSFRSHHSKTLIPLSHLSRPKTVLNHLPFLLFLFSFGLVIPQITSIIRMKGFDNSFVYLFAIVSSLASIYSYRSVYSIKNLYRAFAPAFLTRWIFFILLILSLSLSGPNFLILILSFAFIKGITWGFFLITFNHISLEKFRGEFGVNLGLRSLAYSLGSLAGGFILSYWGYWLFLISSSIMMLGFIIFKKNFRI